MKKKRAFTLIELLVVVAIIALLIAILLPSLSRARELSKRTVCMANCRGIGQSCKIYANDNAEIWPTVAFDQTLLNTPSNGKTITYMTGNVNPHAAPIGMGPFIARNQLSDTAPNTTFGTAMSTTRSFWLMVRSGDLTVKQFICPSASNTVDTTEEINKYYDFQTFNHFSYGIQVPYGPGDTRASENLDNRMALVADASPYKLGNIPMGPLVDGSGSPNMAVISTFNSSSPPTLWRVFNSPNHGGTSTGEGQNVLFTDGHAEFPMKPCVGVDRDNIYTRMGEFSNWFTTPPFYAVWGGKSPWFMNTPNNWFPGGKSLSDTQRASTDSLIYP